MTGLKAFKMKYNQNIVLDVEKEKEEIQNYLDNYEKELSLKKAQQDSMEPDEDGFIKVVNKRRRLSLKG